MELGSWLMLGFEGAVRESCLRIPGTKIKGDLGRFRKNSPSVECRVNLIYSYQDYGPANPRRYEITLEDCEYNIRTSYGRYFTTLAQAKFVADLKLIELGYIIEKPFDVFWLGAASDGE